MSIPSSVTQVLVTLVLIVPGFVFQGVRIRLRGRTPGDTEVSTRILSAIALSTVFALVYVFALGATIVDAGRLYDEVLLRPRGYALLGLAAAFAVPALAAFLVVRIGATQRWQSASNWILSDRWTRIDPRPSAWDVAFQGIGPCYVRVRHKDGSWFAGWFGEESYASSWPDPPSLFVEVSMQVGADGTLGDPVNGSTGAGHRLHRGRPHRAGGLARPGPLGHNGNHGGVAMTKGSSAKTTTLPPRHGGYRAAVDGRFVDKTTASKLPKPPTGKGGGSKVSNG